MRILIATLVSLLCPFAFAETQPWVQPDDVRVTRMSEGFRIEVDMLAPAPLPLVWQVLTDFDNMARFAPNLESSHIVEARSNTLKIEQAGKARFGPFSQHFISVREITLNPQKEIVAKQLSGTAQRMESRMRLKSTDEGTRLEYRAEIVPESPLPPLLGPAFVRHEMVRRNTTPAKPSQAAGVLVPQKQAY